MKRTALVLFSLSLLAAVSSVRHMQLSMAERESEFPVIAYNGQRVAVAWMDGRDGNLEIYANTADLNTRTKGAEHRLTNSANWDNRPDLSWTGSEFGITYIHERRTKFDLYFNTLDSTGKPKGNARRLVSQAPLGKDSVLCWSGAGFGIVASRFAGQDTSDLEFRFVDRSGRIQGSVEKLTSGPGVKVPAKLLRAGNNFGVIYHDSYDRSVKSLNVDPFGRPRGAPSALNLPGTACGFPDADLGEVGMLVAWPQDAGNGQQVMVRLLTKEGDPASDPFPVTEPGVERKAVAVAAGHGGYGVAWIEVTEEGRTLHFIKIDRNGQKEGESVRLSAPRPVRVMSDRMDMTADGQGFVIAWVDVAPPINTEIILSRVSFE